MGSQSTIHSPIDDEWVRDSLGDGLARVGNGKQRMARGSEWTAYCFSIDVLLAGGVHVLQ